MLVAATAVIYRATGKLNALLLLVVGWVGFHQREAAAQTYTGTASIHLGVQRLHSTN
jgi:hypothetical protein